MTLGQMVRFASERATRIFIGGTIAALMYLSFLVAGPIVEAKFFPVVRFDDVVQTRDGDKLTLDTTFDKLRGCEYAGSRWYATNASGRFTDLPMHYNNAPPAQTRPVGENYDRDWTFELPPREDFRSIFLILSHRCGWPWITQTKVGPYKLAGSK